MGEKGRFAGNDNIVLDDDLIGQIEKYIDPNKAVVPDLQMRKVPGRIYVLVDIVDNQAPADRSQLADHGAKGAQQAHRDSRIWVPQIPNDDGNAKHGG
jgi:hypothetical protein